MVRPPRAVLVIPLRPRRIALTALALTGVLALLLVGKSPTEASYAPVPTDPPPELRLIPDGTMVVLHVKMGALMGKELPKALAQLSFSRDGGEREFGLPLAKIENFAFLAGERGSIQVVSSRDVLDREKVVAAVVPRGKEMKYKDKKVYGSPGFREDGGFPFKDFPKDFGKDFPKDRPLDKSADRPAHDFKDVPKDRAVDKRPLDSPKDRPLDKPGLDFPKDRPLDKPALDAIKDRPLDNKGFNFQEEPKDRPLADAPKDSRPTPKDRPAFDKDRPRVDRVPEMTISPWDRAVYFLGDKLYVVGMGRDVMQFIDTAVKPDEKSPLADALRVAGSHHVTFGAAIPEEVSRDMQRGFRFGRDMGPTEMFAYGFKPLLHMKRVVMTGDLGEETRLDGTATFGDARAAERGLDAVKLAVELFKGPLLYLEEQAQETLGEMKPDSALFKVTGEVRSALRNAVVKAEGATVSLSVRAKTEEAAIKAVLTEIAPRVRLAAGKAATRNNFLQMTLAIISYADQNDGEMPPEVIYSKDGKPLFSWRVAILPQLDMDGLYRKIKFDEPWDSEHNKKVLAKTPPPFQMSGVQEEEGMTHFQIFKGAGVLSDRNQKVRFPASFTDGPSQTIFVVTAADPVHWAAPKDIEYSKKVSPWKQVGKHYGKGTMVSFGDGSVHLLPDTMPEADFRAYITPNADDLPGRNWLSGRAEERFFEKEKALDKPARDFYDKKDGGFSKDVRKDK